MFWRQRGPNGIYQCRLLICPTIVYPYKLVKFTVDSHSQRQRVSKKGEVSLTMKHFSVYFYMVHHSLDNVLVLEDDATFDA